MARFFRYVLCIVNQFMCLRLLRHCHLLKIKFDLKLQNRMRMLRIKYNLYIKILWWLLSNIKSQYKLKYYFRSNNSFNN